MQRTNGCVLPLWASSTAQAAVKQGPAYSTFSSDHLPLPPSPPHTHTSTNTHTHTNTPTLQSDAKKDDRRAKERYTV